MSSDLDKYLMALAVADAAGAVAVLESATSRGATPQQLIRDVVVPAQRQVGQLWFGGSWSVADEHAATAVSEQALSLLTPPRPAPGATTRVVLACAEGEWHTLPARLAAELSRSADVDVVFLGGSIPADHLQRHLRATSADVLALSCTMPTNLLGAARSIDAAHAEGLPVLVGGRAWGPGQRRARAMGADLQLEDAAGIAVALDDLAEPAASADIPLEALLLDSPPRELLLLALERQAAANPWMARMTEFQRARSLEDLGWLARHAAAAVACDDPTVVGDLLTWLLDLLVPRGVPAEAVLDSCHFLADAVEPEAPRAAALLRSEATAALGRVGP